MIYSLIHLSSIVFIRFDLSDNTSSTAEGYDVNVVYYFPPYIEFRGIESMSANTAFTSEKNDTAIFIKLPRLHFGESGYCVFSVIIDRLNLYSTYISQYGTSPTTLKIPYNVLYKKYYRLDFNWAKSYLTWIFFSNILIV